MSKKRTIQKQAQNRRAQTAAQTRSAFSIAITFDPAHPQAANVTVMPLGRDGNGGAHIDDVVTALRISYEQAVMQRGAWLLQQQMQANAAQESKPA